MFNKAVNEPLHKKIKLLSILYTLAVENRRNAGEKKARFSLIEQVWKMCHTLLVIHLGFLLCVMQCSSLQTVYATELCP